LLAQKLKDEQVDPHFTGATFSHRHRNHRPSKCRHPNCRRKNVDHSLILPKLCSPFRFHLIF
jgi:hypothetical protein